MRQFIIILLSINLSLELVSSEFLEKKNTIPEAKEVFMVSSYLDKNFSDNEKTILEIKNRE